MAQKQPTVIAAKPVATTIKKHRQRSPNYPAIGLEKALERLQPIKEQAGRHAMPLSVTYDAWNYKSAAGDQTVAALKSFGLVEVLGIKDKRELRVTEAAWRILGNAPDREGLLQVAALKPEIHRKLWDKYEGPPPADSILKTYLIWDLKFNPSFVDSFMAQYRATLAFANITASDSLSGENSETDEVEEAPLMQTTTKPQSLAIAAKPDMVNAGRSHPLRLMTELAFKLSKEADAKIIIYGDASQEAIKKLQELLKISEDTFPTRAELAGGQHPDLPVVEDEKLDQS
jgi:hypothetical protein